jgi:hypothetical protein
VDTYEYLWRPKWYGRPARFHDLDERVSVEMEKFANFAIGDVSRNSEKLRRRLYLLVTDLVESERSKPVGTRLTSSGTANKFRFRTCRSWKTRSFTTPSAQLRRIRD